MNTVAVQLKRSFLAINLFIAFFFIIYLFQAFFLYKRSRVAEQEVIQSNDLIYCIKTLDADNERLAVSVANFAHTGDSLFINEFNRQTYVLKKDIDDLDYYARKKNINFDSFYFFKLLIENKIALYKQLVNPNNNTKNEQQELNRQLNSIDRDSYRYISKVERDAKILADRRNETNIHYSKSRVIFSLISYILISIFLIFTLYKVNQSIRKRTLAEEMARLNEAKYKTLIEDTGLITLVVNQTGIINFASKNIEDLLQINPARLIGKHIIKGVAVGFRRKVLDVISQINHNGFYHNSIELQVQTASGTNKWIMCKVFAVSQDNNDIKEWQVVVWDIDDEKTLQLEVELMETERRNQQKLFQDIIDNIPSVVYLKDTLLRYVMINKNMEYLVGLPAEKILGATDVSLMPLDEVYEQSKAADEWVLQEKSITTLEYERTTHGKTEYYWITKFPLLDEEGHVKNICGLVSEITERKEDEIKLIEAKKEAEDAKAAQEAFLANMSHEIRTPMNGIIGMGNLLLGTELNTEQKEYTDNIQESAKSLLGIINDILDFSKIKSGKFQLERTAFKPKNTITKAIYPLQFRADEKKIYLNLKYSDTIPEVLLGDPLRLQQIIINLAGNAIKFTARGGVDIIVKHREVGTGSIELLVDIKDSGIGIAENKLEKIFESFAQDNENTSRKYGGTGLGLTIVKQLTEMQGGEVHVSSIIGTGSVFSVKIPYTIGDTYLYKEEEQKNEQLGKELLKNIQILVAEDNLINQKVIKSTLHKQGAIVHIVDNGKDAIEQIKTGNFDVILMDLQMPDVDGYKATRYIRQVLKNNLPIFAMTADALKGEAEKCYEAGMTGFISKPFEPKDLYYQILQATENYKDNNLPNKQQTEQAMENPIVDFEFLYEISEKDPVYITDVIDIFLNTMPDGLKKLKTLIELTEDWEGIYKQAHFLKSSVSVVRVRNMFNDLNQIEMLAKNKNGKEEIVSTFNTIQAIFDEALPVILAEKGKYKL